MMIELTQGYHAEIDFSDWWKVQGHKWFAVKRHETWYAETRINDRNIGMHRLIKPGDRVDHRDGNGLNNRWNNLRFATHRQNTINAYRAQTDSGSGYRGAVLVRPGRWQARIRDGGRNLSLGVYTTPEDAAKAYDAAATKLHGEFAFLNFPKEPDNDEPRIFHFYKAGQQ
jgi:hypothetical protein